jgi:hypothetical protein
MGGILEAVLPSVLLVKENQIMTGQINRRKFMGSSLLGVAAGLSLEDRVLLANVNAENTPSIDNKPIGGIPKGKLGKLEVTRLICGGNLFSGFAHSGDLLYVSGLMKSYFTPEKIMDTLQVCEENGINAAVLRCDDHMAGVLKRYRKERGGKIQWIAQTYPSAKDQTSNVQLAIDNGAVAAFPQGGVGDNFVKDGRIDLIENFISLVRRNGLAAGVGSHSLVTPFRVEKEKLQPDFYFKTFNDVDYQTQPPDEIAAFMKTVDKPWIAFKVLGAGRVSPREGFELSLTMGADFLNVGMFDFQVRENIVLVKDIIGNGLQRERPWRS